MIGTTIRKMRYDLSFSLGPMISRTALKAMAKTKVK
jgi:hypothetical protein